MIGTGDWPLYSKFLAYFIIHFRNEFPSLIRKQPWRCTPSKDNNIVKITVSLQKLQIIIFILYINFILLKNQINERKMNEVPACEWLDAFYNTKCTFVLDRIKVDKLGEVVSESADIFISICSCR